jgi:hypothetical protein
LPSKIYRLQDAPGMVHTRWLFAGWHDDTDSGRRLINLVCWCVPCY